MTHHPAHTKILSTLTMITALVLVGCVAPAMNPPELNPAELNAPEEQPDDSASAPVGPCSVEVERALGETIGAQIGALGSGDFEGAYAFAAPEFQESITVELFEIIIRDGFDSLLSADSHTLSTCVYNPKLGRASTVVTVRTTSQEIFTLAYSLRETDQGWRIVGADPVEPVTAVT
jgi:hypothetical protein